MIGFCFGFFVGGLSVFLVFLIFELKEAQLDP